MFKYLNALFFCLLLFHSTFSQIRNPYTEEIIPVNAVGDIYSTSGNFYQYAANYGLLYHFETKYALPYIAIEHDTLNPWMLILNGGPGRSNIRLSFDIDSLVRYYNVLIPGYRGIDDRMIETFVNCRENNLPKLISNKRHISGINAIAGDIIQILQAKHIRNIKILAHSYGTMVAKELYKIKPAVTDTIFAFSPVDPQKPFPAPLKIKKLISRAADSLNVNMTHVEDTLSAWTQSTQKKNLLMGVTASAYRLNDMIHLLNDMFDSTKNRSAIIKKGELFIKKSLLIDFALKFCDFQKPANNKDNIYITITRNFYDIITEYCSDKKCNNQYNPQINYPIQFIIPEYEIFYLETSVDAVVEHNCACGHADLWSKPLEFINF